MVGGTIHDFLWPEDLFNVVLARRSFECLPWLEDMRNARRSYHRDRFNIFLNLKTLLYLQHQLKNILSREILEGFL